MSSSVDGRLLYQIRNAPLRRYPFPHLVVEAPFEERFYRRIRQMMPEASHFRPIAETGRVTPGSYPNRKMVDLMEDNLSLPLAQAVFWKSLLEAVTQSEVINALLSALDIRLPPGKTVKLKASLTRDDTGYALGPHTDVRQKLATALFYLPEDARFAPYGTSIYQPRDPSESFDDCRHHERNQFRLIYTTPFLPNTLFAFARTEDSFHGVEPVTEPGVHRELLILNVMAL